MENAESRINCETFQKHNTQVKELTENIDQAQDIEEKALLAERLKQEMDVLTACQDYQAGSIDCKNCHFVAHLRKSAAELIIKTGKLK